MSDQEPEFLETGHEPNTPEGDSYLRRFLFNWAGASETVARSLGGHAMRTDAFWIADTGRGAGFANAAQLIRPLIGDPAGTLGEIEGFFSLADGNGIRETLIFSPWPTPDLRPFGWELGGHPPVHLLPAGIPPRARPAGFRIEPVTTEADLRRLEQIAIDGYPFPDLQPGRVFGSGLLDDPRFRFWLGFEGNNPAGLAVSCIDHGINQVILVVTLPEARGRGYGEALTWQASTAAPTLPAMLLSSDLGRPVYERMGYLPLFRFTLWYRNRG